MNYKSLIFSEISEIQQQALINLECNWKIRVVLDLADGVHDCILYNEKGAILDSEEGLMRVGVEEFISNSENLLLIHKEIMIDGIVV